jgi:diguanylate cyclase (GGDEF)-like protein
MAWRHLSFSSLRYRLLLLVLVAVLPALALVLLTAWEQRGLAAMSKQEDALRLARLAAATHERLVDGARSLLTGVAELSDVQMHGGAACSAHFAEILKQFPLYTNLGALRPDGHLFCQARPLRGPRSLAGRPEFQRARASRQFTVSSYTLDPDLGRAVLTLFRPAIDRGGAVWAVVFAELDLAWIRQLAEKARLPRGAVATVADVSGAVLARYPDPTPGPGAADLTLVSAMHRGWVEGTLETRDPDGTARLVAFSRLTAPSDPGGVYVSISVPREAVFAEADRLLARNLFWVGLTIVLVFGAAAVLSDLVILRRVGEVVGAAERLTAGDLAARARARGRDEISLMARTFNAMAERLAERVGEEHGARQELAERVTELDLINRLGEYLQASLSLEEAYEVIGRVASFAFPSEAGAVLVMSSARNSLETVAVWGAYPREADPVMPADRCWALRNGHAYAVEDTTVAVVCPHLPRPYPPAYTCVPLMAQGETLGLLYVSGRAAAPSAPGGEARRRFVESVAAQLALGLANLRLRETLRDQSIRDTLTGLFNRRYLEETLERELRRAGRAGRPLGLLMLDVDHFKRLNDALGHEAGDEVLRQLGERLRRALRREDTACRYGGEEFVLVLPDAPPADAARRAEELRRQLHGLTVSVQGRPAGPITVSIGVAAFPDHGLNAEMLLKAADAALYAAKRAGRDRVVVAGVPALEPPPGPPAA